jgi:5'-3' exonuclease
MGIKDFSKVFQPDKVITLDELKGKTIAIDAFAELYRTSLGAKHQHVMTSPLGESTVHLGPLLSMVIKFHRHGINQIWVFDCLGKSAIDSTPEKAMEKEKRRREKAKALLKQQDLFLDNSDEDKQPEALSDEKKEMYYKLSKRQWTISEGVINDMMIILNTFNIKYVISPAGFEGEAICSYLVSIGKADAVYSSDTDPIVFGAKEFIRNDISGKKLQQYTIKNILAQITEKSTPASSSASSASSVVSSSPVVSILDIRKIAVHLGCDFATKTKGIGPSTIFKKYSTLPLTDEQKKAIEYFGKVPNASDVLINNGDKVQFPSSERKKLIDWLVDVKGFSKGRLESAWFSKIDKPIKPKKKRAKPNASVTDAPEIGTTIVDTGDIIIV